MNALSINFLYNRQVQDFNEISHNLAELISFSILTKDDAGDGLLVKTRFKHEWDPVQIIYDVACSELDWSFYHELWCTVFTLLLLIQKITKNSVNHNLCLGVDSSIQGHQRWPRQLCFVFSWKLSDHFFVWMLSSFLIVSSFTENEQTCSYVTLIAYVTGCYIAVWYCMMEIICMLTKHHLGKPRLNHNNFVNIEKFRFNN